MLHEYMWETTIALISTFLNVFGKPQTHGLGWPDGLVFSMKVQFARAVNESSANEPTTSSKQTREKSSAGQLSEGGRILQELFSKSNPSIHY